MVLMQVGCCVYVFFVDGKFVLEVVKVVGVGGVMWCVGGQQMCEGIVVGGCGFEFVIVLVCIQIEILYWCVVDDWVVIY